MQIEILGGKEAARKVSQVLQETLRTLNRTRREEDEERIEYEIKETHRVRSAGFKD